MKGRPRKLHTGEACVVPCTASTSFVSMRLYLNHIRYGAVESVRLRSVPVDMSVSLPRKAKLILGKVGDSGHRQPRQGGGQQASTD